MNKKHFVIPISIIFVITSLIVFLIPTEIKNVTGFWIIYVVYSMYNIISIFLVIKSIEQNLKKDVNGISIFYIFGIFNILLIALLIICKFIYVNTNFLLIIILIIILIYSILQYSLFNSKRYINQKEESNEQKKKNVKKWLSKVEIIINNNDKDNKDLNKLYEIIRYMDPMANEETQELDEKIDKELSIVEKELTKENINKLINLLNERKVITKNNK